MRKAYGIQLNKTVLMFFVFFFFGQYFAFTAAERIFFFKFF